MPIVPFVPLIVAGVGLYSANKSRKAAARESAMARAERAEAKAILEKQKQAYRDIKFTNPYEGAQNQFENMENTFEDITVNQQQAQFQAQQGAQQRANILGSLKGAAGSSGIAGLAQSMANQGQLQTQQISASIGQQEARNQALSAKGAMANQSAERGGAAAVDLQARTGNAMLQEAESGRMATLLGVDMASAAGANKTYQQQLKNQAEANNAADQMQQKSLNTFASFDYGSL